MATPIPENQARFEVSEILALTSGRLLGGAKDVVCRGVTTDSRRDVAGSLFVALSGESFDGHEFIAAVVNAGAVAALVERDVSVPPGAVVIQVSSTLSALGALAREHRRRWAGRLVAVAGSAGKTTTKASIAAALQTRQPGAVHAISGNLNNRVGVPMVLLALEASHRAAVVEIGTNCPGEVPVLSRIVEPDVAVLTLVAIEHSEGLGDLDAIEREEAGVFEGLRPGGIAVANRDDARAWRSATAAAAARVVGYGADAAADFCLTERTTLDASHSRLRVTRPRGPAVEFTAPVVGAPAALALAAAVAVADVWDEQPVVAAELAQALGSSAVLESGRMRPVPLASGALVLDDTYNANPASVVAALRTAQEIAAARGAPLLLVLGEMRELGALSEREHRQLGADIARSGARALVAVAGDARHYLPSALAAGMDAVFCADSDAALGEVRARLTASSVVLVKASRGVRAERIVQALSEGNGRAA
ncbi:MAG: UDP-N-acetylmuramoyl-tripeptide--D-alanyl-D-alanine ligase [Polyangiaceae bacterium]